jgi:hypothetical protein
MDKEQVVIKYQAALKETAFNALRVDTVNHKPDVFMVGPQHFPKDNSMFIKPEQAPCCSCKKDYNEHTYDTVLFLQLVRNVDKDEAQGILAGLVSMMEQDKIDGVVFVETVEKYRIQ